MAKCESRDILEVRWGIRAVAGGEICEEYVGESNTSKGRRTRRQELQKCDRQGSKDSSSWVGYKVRQVVCYCN